jgi:hypothetical protein
MLSCFVLLHAILQTALMAPCRAEVISRTMHLQTCIALAAVRCAVLPLQQGQCAGAA